MQNDDFLNSFALKSKPTLVYKQRQSDIPKSGKKRSRQKSQNNKSPNANFKKKIFNQKAKQITRSF